MLLTRQICQLSLFATCVVLTLLALAADAHGDPLLQKRCDDLLARERTLLNEVGYSKSVGACNITDGRLWAVSITHMESTSLSDFGAPAEWDPVDPYGRVVVENTDGETTIKRTLYGFGKLWGEPTEALWGSRRPQCGSLQWENATDYSFSFQDVDEDGEMELFVHATTARYTEYPAVTQAWVVTRSGDDLVPFPGTEKLHITHTTDLDRDGRLDLVVESPYQGYISAYSRHRGPHVVLQQWDRQFSARAPSAIAELKRQCPSKQLDLSAYSHRERDLDRWACARIWGMSKEEVRRRSLELSPPTRTERQRRDFAGVELVYQWIDIEPPFKLRQDKKSPHTP